MRALLLTGLALTASPILAQDTTDIQPGPAFSAAQLLQLPREGWITNGGDLYDVTACITTVLQAKK